MSEVTKGQTNRANITLALMKALPKYCPCVYSKLANKLAFEFNLSPDTVRYRYLSMFIDIGILFYNTNNLLEFSKDALKCVDCNAPIMVGTPFNRCLSCAEKFVSKEVEQKKEEFEKFKTEIKSIKKAMEEKQNYGQHSCFNCGKLIPNNLNFCSEACAKEYKEKKKQLEVEPKIGSDATRKEEFEKLRKEFREAVEKKKV